MIFPTVCNSNKLQISVNGYDAVCTKADIKVIRNVCMKIS